MENGERKGKGRGFEFLKHTADFSMRVWGRDLEKLFENAARGVAVRSSGKTIDELAKGEAGEERGIELEAGSREDLLVDFLNELVYLHDVNREYYLGAKEIAIEKMDEKGRNEKMKTGEGAGGEGEGGGRFRLRAILRSVRAGKDEIEIKAATHYNLEVMEGARGFEATVTFDV